MCHHLSIVRTDLTNRARFNIETIHRKQSNTHSGERDRDSSVSRYSSKSCRCTRHGTLKQAAQSERGKAKSIAPADVDTRAFVEKRKQRDRTQARFNAKGKKIEKRKRRKRVDRSASRRVW